MRLIVEWLSQYGAEYDVVHKKVYIRKPMRVGDFYELRKILLKLGVKDIIIENGGKIYERKF